MKERFSQKKTPSMQRNNRYLLDTHIFIWWMRKSEKIKVFEPIFLNPEIKIYLSVVNIWEIVVKKKIGKLRPPRGWKEDVMASGFEILPISLEHIYSLENLPLYHKDPFDRMLVAQAKVEDLTLITNDKKIWKYKIDVLKA